MPRLPSPYDRLLLPIYIPSALMAVATQGMIILLPLYVLSTGGSPAFAAVVVGLNGLGVLLLDVPAGVLVGRYGDRPVMLGGLATLLVTAAGFAVASDGWMVALIAIPYGGGTAAWLLGRQSYITRTGLPRERGRAVAVMGGIQRVGAFAGPLTGGLVADALGYEITFAGGAVLAVLAIILVSVHIGETSGSTATPASPARIVVEHGRLFATAGSAALALQLMRATRQILIPLFGNGIGLDAAAIGLVYSLGAALDMSLFWPVGIVMDRWGRKWSGVPSMLAFAVGLTVLPLADSFTSLLGAALLLGLANGLGAGLVMIIGMDLAPADTRGQFLGVWRLIADVGGVGGPMLAGLLVNLASLSAASFLGAGVGVAGALVLLLLVPEPLHHDHAVASKAAHRSRGGENGSGPAPMDSAL